MPDKIMRCHIEIVDGITCVVFSGKGKNLCVPAQGLKEVFDDATAKYIAFEAEKGRQPGQWVQFHSANEPRTWNTGTTDDGKVAVTVDRHLPSEQTLVLSRDNAKELGRQLIGAADVQVPPQTRN